MNTETSGLVDVVTDPKLCKTIPAHNITIAGHTMSFEWKDPDGDSDRWQLELTGKDAGQIVWLNLPSDAKVQPIPITKTVTKS